MAQTHGTNVVLHIWTSTGSLDMSGDFNSANLRWDKNNPETTTFGKTTVQRISGIRDYSLDFAGIFNSGATCAMSHIVSDMNGSLYSQIRLAPAGSVSGSPIYTGCVLVSTFGVTGPQNGPVAMNVTFQSGTGSLTAACVA